MREVHLHPKHNKHTCREAGEPWAGGSQSPKGVQQRCKSRGHAPDVGLLVSRADCKGRCCPPPGGAEIHLQPPILFVPADGIRASCHCVWRMSPRPRLTHVGHSARGAGEVKPLLKLKNGWNPKIFIIPSMPRSGAGESFPCHGHTFPGLSFDFAPARDVSGTSLCLALTCKLPFK